MATAAYNSTIRVTSQPSIAFTDEATSTSDRLTYSITNTAKQFLDRDVAVVVQAQYDEVQTVTITGSPTGGTFTLTFGGNTTSAIAYNATAATVQAALVALASIGASNMLVTGPNGGPYTCEFTAAKGLAAQVLMTASGASLTGGTSPGVTVTRWIGGATWATISSGFTLYRVYARVVFLALQAPGTQVRLHSGNYYVVASVGNASVGSYAGKVAMDTVTTFSTTGADSFLPTTRSGTLKFSTFHLSSARVKSLYARDLLILDFSVAGGDDYAGYCYASDSNIKSDPKKAIGEDLTFQLTDEFFNS